MARIYLTTAERDAAKEKQKQQALLQKLADGLAMYRNRNGLTRAELGQELGLCGPTVTKLLTCQPTLLRTDELWKIFAVAGLQMEQKQC